MHSQISSSSSSYSLLSSLSTHDQPPQIVPLQNNIMCVSFNCLQSDGGRYHEAREDKEIQLEQAADRGVNLLVIVSPEHRGAYILPFEGHIYTKWCNCHTQTVYSLVHSCSIGHTCEKRKRTSGLLSHLVAEVKAFNEIELVNALAWL